MAAFTIKEHQVEAIDDILSELARQRSQVPELSRKIAPIENASPLSAKAQSIMACGTGKTMISQRLADALTASDASQSKYIGRNTVLVCVPSLSLVKQTLASYLRFEVKPFVPLVVCSADDAVRSAREKAGVNGSIETDEDTELDEELSSIEDMRAENHPPTTDPQVVASFLQKASGDQNRLHIIFSTYHSSKVMEDAQLILKKTALGKPHRFALINADEAHNLAGEHDRDYACILNDDRIGADNRVFTTATPKLFVKPSKDDVEFNKTNVIRIASMDDHAVFGPVAHRLPFRKAVEKKLLVNYKTIVLEVDQEEIDQFLAKSNSNTGIAIVANQKVMEAKQKDALAKIAMTKVLHELSLRRVISYHSRIDDAQAFVGSDGNGEISRYQKQIPSLKDYAESIYGKEALAIREECVSSRTKSQLRSKILAEFEEKDDTPYVLSSVNCLGEGVDVPDLNAVMFVDPRSSTQDIVQIIGRTMRLPGDGIEKDVGYIILPVVVDKSKTLEQRLEDSSYKKVWAIIKGLTEIDPDFSDELLSIKNLIRKSNANNEIDVESQTKATSNMQETLDRLKQSVLDHVVFIDSETATRENGIKNAVNQNLEGQSRQSHAATISKSKMTVDKMAEGLILKIVNSYADNIIVDVSNKDELHQHIHAYFEQLGEYPKRSSGKITGTDDNWVNVNLRIRRTFPGNSLLTVVNEMKGVAITGIKINVLDKEELIEQIQFHYDGFKKYPNAKTEGIIKGTDDTWRAVDARIRREFPGESLSTVLGEIQGVKIMIDVTNTGDLNQRIQQHYELFGKYPTAQSKGKITGTDDTWMAVDARIRKAFSGSSLSKIIDEIRGVKTVINVLNKDELTKTIQDQFDEFGQYPNRTSGAIAGTDDTWRRVDDRIRNAYPELSLDKFIAQMTAFVKIDVLNLQELHRYIQHFHSEYGSYPSVTDRRIIVGTADTWTKVDSRIRNKIPGSSLSKVIEQISGGQINVLDKEKLTQCIQTYFKEFGKYPLRETEGKIKGTDDTWGAVNSRIRKEFSGHSLSTFISEMCGGQINVRDRDELHRHIQAHFEELGRYPNCNLNDKIKGSGDSWSAVDRRIKKTFPGSSLSKIVAEFSGGQINVLDKEELVKWIKQFAKDNDGKYPNSGTKGKIPGTNDAWKAIDERIKKAFPGESLSTVTAEFKGVEMKNRRPSPN